MPTVTLAQLQQYALDRLEDNTELYTAAQLTATINEAYQIINAFTGVNQSTVAIGGGTVTGSGVIYSTPSPIFIPLVVTVNGVNLRKLSLAALARNYPNWATDNTSTNGPIQRWAPMGISRFIVHPMDSVGGRTMTMTGVVNPTPLAAGGDTLSLTDAFLDMTVSYVVHRIQLKVGGRAFSQASLALQEFYHELKQYSMYQNFRAPRYWVLTAPAQN